MIKQYEKRLILMMLQKKKQKNILAKNKLATNSWLSIQGIHNWRVCIWKTNTLFNLIIHQLDIDKFHLYAKIPYEAKYLFFFYLINETESIALIPLNDSKTFIEYLYDMDDIYKSIEEYNPNKKGKILIDFDIMKNLIQ